MQDIVAHDIVANEDDRRRFPNGQYLSGKVALITGASRGIGAAIALELARAGARVAASYRVREQQARDVAERIRALGGECELFQADVADPAQISALVSDVARRFGRIDILVNNAGVWASREFGANDAQVFAQQFDTNVRSVLLMTEAAVAHYPSSGGRVINLSSSLAASPLQGAVVYSAAKAAVSALTRGFAKELGPRNITVNAVAPSVTATDMTADLPPEERAALTRATPLRRLGTPKDIAGAVGFLASSAADWITGQTILVDGGLVDT